MFRPHPHDEGDDNKSGGSQAAEEAELNALLATEGGAEASGLQLL